MPTTLTVQSLANPWQWGEYESRVRACARLRLAVRRLLAFEWARAALADAKRVLPLFERVFPDDPRPREAIEAAELLIAQPDSRAAVSAATDAADAARAATDAADAAAYAAYAADAAVSAAYAADAADAADAARAARAATDAARAAARAAAARAAAAAAAADAAATAADAAADARWQWIGATFRHALGPGYAFRPEWRTSTAVALARGIVGDRAFDRMPILADALQDAGCADPDLIRHLQFDRDEWTAADWVLCELLEVTT